MKIDREELYRLYMEWVNNVADECDWKTHFGPEEIVYSIANIIETKMATGTLTFNLDDLDDKQAHLRAIKSTSLAIVLWDMDQYLRSETKYAPDSMPDEVYKALIGVRDKLHEIMSDHSIDLDELMS